MMLNIGWDGGSNLQMEEIYGSGQFCDVKLQGKIKFFNLRNHLNMACFNGGDLTWKQIHGEG